MLETALRTLRRVLSWFSFAAMLLMLLIIFAQVITRYVFGYTAEWSEELARFLFVWVVFLGSALVMGERGHLAVEFIPHHFKGKPFGKVLEVVVNLSSYAFILLLFTQGAKMTRTMTFQRSPGMDVSMSIVYAVIPLSSALMLLYVIRDSIRIVKGTREPSKESTATVTED